MVVICLVLTKNWTMAADMLSLMILTRISL